MKKTSKGLIAVLLPLILLFYMTNPAYTETTAITPYTLNEHISQIFQTTQTSEKNAPSPPEIYDRCATPIIITALAHEDWLEPEHLFILRRPDDPSYIRYYSPDTKVYWTYDTPEGHFKIHYNESGIHAVLGSDGLESTIPDYVISFGNYFEEARDHEVNLLGYDPPPPDGTQGGDDRFDVYLLDMQYYGYTSIQGGHPYIVVHKDYTDYESNLDPAGTRAGNMKITAAHEFFHAIQFFYDDWNYDNIWWEECTAVWMEDEVFDYVDGYLNYLGNPFDDLNDNLAWDNGEPWYNHDSSFGGNSERPMDVWFEAPHVSMDTIFNSTFERYEYGGVVWAKYLDARFGKEFIKECFIKTNYYTDIIPVLEDLLQEYGTNLGEAFSDFRVNILSLDIFEEGARYPLIHHQKNYGEYPISINQTDISHLACRYIGLKPPIGDRKLVIDVDGQDGSSLGLAILLFTQNGHHVRYVNMDDLYKQTGRAEIVSFGTEGFYRRATLIPMNLSTVQNYRYMSISIHLEGLINYSLRLKEGINMVGLPTNVAGASTSYELIQNYFDIAEDVQLLGYDSDISLWQISYMQGEPKGSMFSIEGIKGYMLSVSEDKTIYLSGESSDQVFIDILPGHNMISSFFSEKEPLYADEILKSLDAEHGSSANIQRYDSKQGRWQSRYWFFRRPVGDNFTIQKGDGYLIDDMEGHLGWAPPDS